VRCAARPLALLLLGLALAGPAGAQSTEARPDWRGTGVVLATLPPPSDLHPTRPVVVLQHDPIPHLMEESMAMPFLVADGALLERVRPGDRVTFALKETADALLVIEIEPVP
jgi:hypothetical protein